MNLWHLLILLFSICSWSVCVIQGSLCDFAQVCLTDLSEGDCGPGEILVPGSNIFNCCPSCQPNITAVPSPGECGAPQDCLPDGRYAPVQCKGDTFTGRCFCTDEDGNRIFGQMWRSEASEMTCACSRRRWELEKAGRVVTLHCTATGDYEPLQCDDGMCWCAHPKDGQPTVSPVPEEAMNLLPCFCSNANEVAGRKASIYYTFNIDFNFKDSATALGEQYLRRCESLVYALAVIKKEQSEHGTNFLGSPTAFCDYDGSYGPYQIRGSSAYCTGRDGEILGAWQASSNEINNMNCNCARDSAIYFPERGMEMTAVCQGNGNYQPNQNAGDVYYCVDTDGYHTELLEAWPADNCASYA